MPGGSLCQQRAVGDCLEQDQGEGASKMLISVPLMYDDGAGQPTRIIRCKLSENIFRHMELATLLSSLRVCFSSTLGLGKMTMIISIQISLMVVL